MGGEVCFEPGLRRLMACQTYLESFSLSSPSRSASVMSMPFSTLALPSWRTGTSSKLARPCPTGQQAEPAESVVEAPGRQHSGEPREVETVERAGDGALEGCDEPVQEHPRHDEADEEGNHGRPVHVADPRLAWPLVEGLDVELLSHAAGEHKVGRERGRQDADGDRKHVPRQPDIHSERRNRHRVDIEDV